MFLKQRTPLGPHLGEEFRRDLREVGDDTLSEEALTFLGRQRLEFSGRPELLVSHAYEGTARWLRAVATPSPPVARIAPVSAVSRPPSPIAVASPERGVRLAQSVCREEIFDPQIPPHCSAREVLVDRPPTDGDDNADNDCHRDSLVGALVLHADPSAAARFFIQHRITLRRAGTRNGGTAARPTIPGFRRHQRFNKRGLRVLTLP